MASPYFLYILYSEKLDRYYVGISQDPGKRLESHNTYPRGWTRRGVPWVLVFQKPFANRAEAQKWERYLKHQKNRALIERVVRGEFQW